MSVPAAGTAAEAIARACGALAELHVLPTLRGARTADLLQEILAASHEQQGTIDSLVSALLETESELDNMTGT